MSIVNPNDKHCQVCNISYDDQECPSCNPKHTYYVEIGIPDGADDFTFQECECNECPNNGYWNKQEAISHAKACCINADSLVRVCDDEGTEVYANR